MTRDATYTVIVALAGTRVNDGRPRAGRHEKVMCHARKNQKEVDVGNGFVVWTD